MNFLDALMGRLGNGRQAAILAIGVIATALVYGVSAIVILSIDTPAASDAFLDKWLVPVSAGIVALIAAANSSLSALQVRSVLLSTAHPLSSLAGAVITGGIGDANAAVASALGVQLLAPCIGPAISCRLALLGSLAQSGRFNLGKLA